MKNDLQTEVIADLKRRKKTSRECLRSLSPSEKIAKLVDLQQRYYEMLEVRQRNGGRAIPEQWRKWYRARYENGGVPELSTKIMENLIECNPKIMLGKPVIKGTRITVELILEKFAAGESVENILLQHPHLTKEKVSSAVRFALQNLQKDFPPRSENRKLLDALNDAYANDNDEEEKQFLRLAKIKQSQVLDEWK